MQDNADNANRRSPCAAEIPGEKSQIVRVSEERGRGPLKGILSYWGMKGVPLFWENTQKW